MSSSDRLLNDRSWKQVGRRLIGTKQIKQIEEQRAVKQRERWLVTLNLNGHADVEVKQNQGTPSS
jgi:hypothetical protein